MTTKVQSNADGSSSILNGAVEAIHIATDGKVILSVPNFADDSAAATGGVPIGGVYRTGATVKARVT